MATQQLAYGMHMVDTVHGVVSEHNMGGYGLALLKLCALLGCTDNSVQQLLTDAPLPKPDNNVGWCNVSDGEGEDHIYHNGELVASVTCNSRGAWYAVAELPNGKRYFTQGANAQYVCDNWVESAPS